MEKLYASKAFLKMAGGRMYTPGPHPTLLDPPLAMSHKNHQKCLAYFRYLALLVLFFFTQRQSQKRAILNLEPCEVLIFTNVEELQRK